MCCIVPRSSHLKQRFASESNALNHHDTTSYNHYYGDCKQEITSHRNSGFVSNVRPSLLYNCKVHAKNKPDLRSITNNNYIYTTHKDFLPYIMPSGKEFLPYLINEPLKENEDSSVFSAKIEFPDKNVKNILTPTLPRGYLLPRKTDFHIGKVKNLLHGPDTHSTTYMVDYSQIEPRRNDMFNVTIGRKEESGPTRSTSNFNPINNCFGHSFKPGQSSWKTDESTEKSVYMSDFGDFYHQNSSEPFPYWLDNSLYQKPDHYFVKNKHWPESKSHSYSVYDHPEDLPEERLKNLKKTDLAEYQNVIHRSIEPSMSKGSHTGLQHHPKSSAEMLGRVTIGPLEPGGSTLNASGYVQSQDLPRDRFVTHNMTRFYCPPPGQDKKDREGHIQFNTQPSNGSATYRSVF